MVGVSEIPRPKPDQAAQSTDAWRRWIPSRVGHAIERRFSVATGAPGWLNRPVQSLKNNPMNLNSFNEIRVRILVLATAFALVFSMPHLAAAATGRAPALKPDEFLRDWLLLKPIPVPRDGEKTPSDEEQRRAFARDWLASVGGETGIKPAAGMKLSIENRQFEWQAIKSKENIVDLRAGSDPVEFAVAYAWTEFDVEKETKGLLGVGSDDGVKVWLNGKLIHENWVGRPVQVDEDLVPVVLPAGKNQLLLKVQNGISEWGFACRLMGPESQARKLVAAAWNSGDATVVQRLLDSGLDINSRSPGGLTAWLAARLKGQTELAEFLAAKGADTNATLPPPEKSIDALFQNLIKPSGPGAAVLVARDGKVLFEKGYGLADVEHHRSITPETKFRIGSITKQFTASAILKLQEQGKLNVEDKLSKYYPDYPRGSEVALRHLLTHTSGIHSYTDKPGFMDSVTKPITADALVKSFENDPFDFNPGKKWSYCNSGFFLLGCIVEKVSGQSYEAFLRKSIFEPLGMTNTGVHHSDLALTNVALGYDGGPKRAVNWDMSWAGGAGALYSTVEDLYRWNEAIFHGKVLTPASLEAAFKPVKTEQNRDDTSENGYGYGWAIGKFRGASEISHGGGLNGFLSFLLRLPGKNFTVGIAANGAPNFSPQAIAHEVTELCLGMELEPRPKSVNVPLSALDLIAGRYDYGEAVLMVEHEGEHLFAQLGMQPRFEIFPKSETEFFWKVVDAQVQFVKSSDGKIVKAIHHQNGGTINAPRLKDLKVAVVDPSAYDALVGSYKTDQSDLIAKVSREGNRLFGQMGDQPKVELLPKSETEFGLRELNAQVMFVKDANGKVNKVRLVQGGQTNEAVKIK